MRSIPVDGPLTIVNMTTEWGALKDLFSIDPVPTMTACKGDCLIHAGSRVGSEGPFQP
jgi:hypothetical protein